MLTARLVLRAIRWRAGAAVAVLVVAVIAVASAALGPLYLHAVDGGVLRQTLMAAPRSDTDVFAYITSSPVEKVDWASAMNDLVAPLRGSRWFLPALQRRQAEVMVAAPNGGHYATRLVHVEGDCGHLHFVAGRCPKVAGEVAVSKRTTDTGLGLGDSFPAELADGVSAVDVVGVYEPVEPTGTFWGGAGLFDAKPTTSDTVAPRIDSFFVAPATLDRLSATVPIDYIADVPLVVDAVRLGDLAALDTLASNAEAVGRQAQGIGGSVGTGVPRLVDDVHTGERIPATLVLVASTQLALLALVVLAVVVWSIASTRASEAALAKLRGRGSGAVAVLATGEPVAMALLAWPIGVLVARLVVGALAPSLVGAGAQVAVTANAVALGAAVAATAVVVCIAAAGQLLRASVASLFRHGGGGSSRSATARLMGEAVVLVLAAGSSFELKARGLGANGKPDALAVVVPTLIAAAAAIVLMHLLPLVMRPFVKHTRDTSGLTSFLVVRQLSRRPTGLRVAAVVAVATGIAMFAATSWATAAHNRELRAKGDVGAAEVLTVQTKSGIDLAGAVRNADPGGQEAMAVESRQGATTPIIAVDSARLPGIAAWVPANSSFSLSQLARLLQPAVPPPVILHGTSVRLQVRAPQAPPDIPVHLLLQASDPQHRPLTVDLGRLRPGTADYDGTLSPDCVAGCRLAAITMAFEHPAKVVPDLVPPAIEVDCLDIETPSGPVDAGFTKAGRWRAEPFNVASVQVATDALEIELRYDPVNGVWGSALPTDVPAALPAVTASVTAADYAGTPTSTIQVPGLDGDPLSVDDSVVALSLPQVDRNGVMVDLTLAQRAQTNVVSAATVQQVWLAPGAPAGLRDRLTAAGLTIVGSRSAAEQQRTYDHSGPTYAIQLFLVMAAVAGLLAVGIALAQGLISSRRRAYDLASLRVVGVPRRVLRRGALAEQAVIVTLGLAVGVASGLSGGLFAARRLPFFVHADQGPPLVWTVPGQLLVVIVAGLFVLFAAACFAVEVAALRRAGVARLREGEQ